MVRSNLLPIDSSAKRALSRAWNAGVEMASKVFSLKLSQYSSQSRMKSLRFRMNVSQSALLHTLEDLMYTISVDFRNRVTIDRVVFMSQTASLRISHVLDNLLKRLAVFIARYGGSK